MIDFRGTLIEVGDTIVYIGRHEIQPFLNEGTVVGIRGVGEALLVRPTGRTSDHPGAAKPTGRLVWLRKSNKIVVVRKIRAASVGLPSDYLTFNDVQGYAGPRED